MALPLHIGLIGCGLWGRHILRDLLSLGARVTVAEPAAESAAEARRLGASTVLPEAAALGRLDGYVVATPAATHAAVLGVLLGRGLPVLCEKPLSHDLASARGVAAQARGPVHLVDVWRTHPAVQRLAELAGDGSHGRALGLRLTRANWTSPRTDVDSLWNLGPHEVSVYLGLFDQYPEPRAALADRVDGSIRGLYSHWGRAPWMASEISNRLPERRREIRLHLEGAVASFVGSSGDHVEVASGPADAALAACHRQRLAIDPEPALRRQLASWLGFLRGGPEPASDLAHGLRVVELLARLARLAEDGESG